MPLLGAHMSISGGIHRAFERIEEVEGKALQVFVKNQRQWHTPELPEEQLSLVREYWDKTGRIPVAAHGTYLINLASSSPTVVEKSLVAFAEELNRTEYLGIPYLIIHPGAHLGQGVEEGLLKFVRNMDRSLAISKTSEVQVLIENTAGQGTQLGATFEEIAVILERSVHPERLGVCFDTCHGFAAGYRFDTPAAYRETFLLFDALIGIPKLRFFHLNDSKNHSGSRVDRHEHIGKGNIGLDAFRLLLNDSRFEKHPMVLETPKVNGLEGDRENLEVLRSLINQRLDP